MFGERWPWKESIPQGLKPRFSLDAGRAKAEALAYLEAHGEKLLSGEVLMLVEEIRWGF